jgi:hypothetical protein
LKRIIAVTVGIAACLLVSGSLLRADDKDKKQQTNTSSSSSTNLSKATTTVTNIQQAQPPQVSTGTKPSMVGVPTSEFRPPQKAPVIRDVPPPVRTDRTKNLNPQNDPDVKRGLEGKN